MADRQDSITASLQLFSISSQLLVTSTQIYQYLQDVPAEFKDMIKAIQQLTDVLHTISPDLKPTAEQKTPSSEQGVAAILRDTVIECKKLEIFLDTISLSRDIRSENSRDVVISQESKSILVERTSSIKSLASLLHEWHKNNQTSRMKKKLTRIVKSPLRQQPPQSSIRRRVRTFFSSSQRKKE